eukprot:GHVS01069086.1.p1 GENE.GHVS01069086.1~~GHVS01069086.1.p1  ORF type:complete len:611 (+),score=102.37 GHVS01069086.1:239-1834(+)
MGSSCAQNCDRGVLFCSHKEDGRNEEDCLQLNVYVPHECDGSPLEADVTLPVVLFWHGGAYASGTTTGIYNGHKFSVKTCSILVTANYRLGIFGFLRFGGTSRGNQGFADQQAALKWTATNIQRFGGNPNRITIMGHSAGASSVWYHLGHPVSLQYISGAALFSPSLGLPPKTPEETEWLSAQALSTPSLVKLCGSPPSQLSGESYQIYMGCLQTKPSTQQLLDASQRAQDKAVTRDFFWALHGWDITEDEALLNRSHNPDVKVLISFVSDEGTFVRTVGWLDVLLSKRFLFDSLIANAFKFHPEVLRLSHIYAYPRPPPENSAEWFSHLAEALRDYLLGLAFQPVPQDQTSSLQEGFGDFVYTCAGRFFARKLSAKGSSVYLYVHQEGFEWTRFLKENADEVCVKDDHACNYFASSCSQKSQVCHWEDMPFLFQQPISALPLFQPSPSETARADAFLGYIRSFFHTGDPNGPSSPSTIWRPVTQEDYNWVSIDEQAKPVVSSDYKSLKCGLWDQVTTYDRTWVDEMKGVS